MIDHYQQEIIDSELFKNNCHFNKNPQYPYVQCRTIFFTVRRQIDDTYNLRMPDSEDFFHGASSGSYGKGPCTGASFSSSGLRKKCRNAITPRSPATESSI